MSNKVKCSLRICRLNLSRKDCSPLITTLQDQPKTTAETCKAVQRVSSGSLGFKTRRTSSSDKRRLQVVCGRQQMTAGHTSNISLWTQLTHSSWASELGLLTTRDPFRWLSETSNLVGKLFDKDMNLYLVAGGESLLTKVKDCLASASGRSMPKK